MTAAGIEESRLLRSISKGGKGDLEQIKFCWRTPQSKRRNAISALSRRSPSRWMTPWDFRTLPCERYVHRVAS